MIKNGISINGIIFLLIIFLLGGCVAVKPLEKNSISGQTTNDEEMYIELAILYDQITSDVTNGSADCWKSILTDRSIRLECKYDLVRAIHANGILTGSDNDKTNQAIKKSLYIPTINPYPKNIIVHHAKLPRIMKDNGAIYFKTLKFHYDANCILHR